MLYYFSKVSFVMVLQYTFLLYKKNVFCLRQYLVLCSLLMIMSLTRGLYNGEWPPVCLSGWSIHKTRFACSASQPCTMQSWTAIKKVTIITIIWKKDNRSYKSLQLWCTAVVSLWNNYVAPQSQKQAANLKLHQKCICINVPLFSLQYNLPKSTLNWKRDRHFASRGSHCKIQKLIARITAVHQKVQSQL